MKIIVPELNDLKEIVSIRSKLFSDSASTKLGEKYSIRVFEMYLKHNNFFIFIAKIDNNCAGYIVGMLSESHRTGLGSVSTTIKYTFWHGLISIVKKPILVYEFLFNYKILKNFKIILLSIIRMKPKQHTKSEMSKDNKIFCLVDFGVDPNYQDTLVSAHLMKYIEKFSRTLDATKMISSIKKENPIMILYKYLKWEVTKEDEKSYGLEKQLK